MWTNSSKAASIAVCLLSILRSGSSFAGVLPGRVKTGRRGGGSTNRDPSRATKHSGINVKEAEPALKKRTPSDEMERVTAERVSAKQATSYISRSYF